MFEFLFSKPKPTEQKLPPIHYVADEVASKRKARDEAEALQADKEKQIHDGRVQDLSPLIRLLRELETTFKGRFSGKPLTIESHMQKDWPMVEVYLGKKNRVHFEHILKFYAREEVYDDERKRWAFHEKCNGDVNEVIRFLIDLMVEYEDR